MTQIRPKAEIFYRQHGEQIGFTINMPTPRYIDEIMRLECFKDLLRLGAFPNSKEVTETMAAWRAVRKYLWRDGVHPSLPDVDVVVVGDGSTPRTGALFAMLSRWRVWSIDPALSGKETQWESQVRRLRVIGRKIEEAPVEALSQRVILIAVHNHAKMLDSIDWVRRSSPASEIDVVAMPCCYDQSIPWSSPTHSYEDWGCWSEKRRMFVWRSVSVDGNPV